MTDCGHICSVTGREAAEIQGPGDRAPILWRETDIFSTVASRRVIDAGSHVIAIWGGRRAVRTKHALATHACTGVIGEPHYDRL